MIHRHNITRLTSSSIQFLRQMSQPPKRSRVQTGWGERPSTTTNKPSSITNSSSQQKNSSQIPIYESQTVEHVSIEHKTKQKGNIKVEEEDVIVEIIQENCIGTYQGIDPVTGKGIILEENVRIHFEKKDVKNEKFKFEENEQVIFHRAIRKSSLIPSPIDISPFGLAIREYDNSKPAPNFFLSLKINEPTLLQTIQEKHQELSERKVKIQSLSTLHITLLLLRILTLEDLKKAQQALTLCNKELSSLSIGFRGISTFNNAVIFVKPMEEETDRLVEIMSKMKSVFEDAGVPIYRDKPREQRRNSNQNYNRNHRNNDNGNQSQSSQNQSQENLVGIENTEVKTLEKLQEEEDPVPHLTIGRAYRLNRTDSELLKTSLKRYEITDFGRQTFNSIDLCSRNLPKRKDGYYWCL